MANYNVDIEVAVKGQAKVKSLQRELTQLQNAVDKFNKPIDATPFITQAKKQKAMMEELIKKQKELKVLEKETAAQFTRNMHARRAAMLRTVRLEIAERKKLEALAAERQRGLGQYAVAIGPEPDRLGMLRKKAQMERLKLSSQIAFNTKFELALATQLVGKDRERNMLQERLKAIGQVLISNEQALTAQKEKSIAADRRALQFQQQQRRQRIGGALSSGLIGGGFPLLFGQGGASAVGGALGGIAGGAIGGGFGFALSIIGTALGQVIEKNKQFRDSLEEINRSFSNTGNGAKLFREDIDQLAKSLGVTKDEALEVAQAFAFLGSPELTGQAGKIFGKDKGLFQAVAAIKDEATFATALEQSLKRLSVQEVDRLRTELATASALDRQIALTDALNRKAGKQVVTSEFQRRRQARVPGFKAETTLVPAAPKAIGQAGMFAEISPLMQVLEKMRARPTKLTQAETGESIERSLKRQLARYEEIEPFARKTAIVNAEHLITLERIAKVKDVTKRTQLEELAGAVKQARLNDIEAQKIEQRGRDALDLLREQKRLRKEVFEAQQEQLKKTQQLAKGLSDTIRDGFVDGIKAATDETRTLADALANMLNRLSDQLLNIAANMAFYGNAQGSLSQGQGIIGTLLGSIPGLFNVTSTAGPGGYTIPDAAVPKFRANGGAVGAGRPYIVGERGPELFVPGAQGNVVSNSAMGGTSVVVNVDASGTEVQGNQGGAEQLGRLIGAAVQAELIKQKRPGGLLTR